MFAEFGMTVLIMVSIVGVVIGIAFLVYNWRNNA